MKLGDFTKSVLITGTSRGMGLGYVIHYLKKGTSVVAAVKNPKNALELLKLQKEHLDKLLILELDVASETSISRFVNLIRVKGVTFSIAINNAGISTEEEFGKWTLASFETHLRINTIGPALVSQAIAPFLEEGSKLVQVGSGMGSLTWNLNPKNGLDAYAVSKCALLSITRRLAEKLRANNIVVLAINPGWVKTEMGGNEAISTVVETVENISETIQRATINDTGRFLSDKGETIPW